MHGGRSNGSDSETEPNAVSEQEAELLKLTTQYRLLENEGRMHNQKIYEQIKKQKTQMDMLNQEKIDLETNMKIVENWAKHPRDKKTVDDLKTIKIEKDILEEEIANEKKKHLDLDSQIKDEKKSSEKSMKLERTGTKDSMASAKGKDQAKVKKIEDQLQLANNKFGKLLETNRVLRGEIDDLRVRRQRFDTIYGRLDQERQSLQTETSMIIQQSTLAYDQRVEAQDKIRALNEKAHKDENVHTSEMKELVRVIDHDRRLHDFMTTKGKGRDEDKKLKVWREHKEAAAQERKRAMQTDTVESYEEAFQRIQEITDEKDIDIIAAKFIEAEDENFALYNFVNNQNDIIEHLKENIVQIEEKIENFERVGIRSEKAREEMLTDVNKQKQLFSEMADADEKQLNTINCLLEKIKSKVISIFEAIKCERGEVENCLGADQGITDKNLLKYLALVEQQTNQLLLAKSFTTSPAQEAKKKKVPTATLR